jgi:hypothetical protein
MTGPDQSGMKVREKVVLFGKESGWSSQVLDRTGSLAV